MRLSKDYDINDYECLGEKGKAILLELESYNIYKNSYASAFLCRSILEYVIRKLCEICNVKFDDKSLSASHSACVNALRANFNANITPAINDKRHKILSNSVKKEKFLDILNSWVHSDSLICVQVETLLNGWRANRLLIEVYLDYQNK